jgi:hypothetical protein
VDLDLEEKHKIAARMLDRLMAHGVIGDWADGRLFVPDLYLHGLGMYRAGG